MTKEELIQEYEVNEEEISDALAYASEFIE